MAEPGNWTEWLMTSSLEEFLSPEAAAAEAKAEREKRVAAQESFYSESEEGRRRARMKQEQAELDGHLAADAEMFRDVRLKPRLTEIHQFEQTVRTPIVQGLLFRNTLAWVAGQSGTFKSFITADLAFRYGSDDMDYHGKRMTSGRTLLIIAEGAGGYADRRAAWEAEHDREVKNVIIYPAPLQLADTLKEMPALISYLREEEDAGRGFGLIVFDTQAMCTVGIDENQSEMNLVINVLHRIREVSGACVLTVHHFGKKKENGMRGSSMIYAAADTVIVIEKEKDAMEVTLSTGGEHGKQKDAVAETDLLTLHLKSHDVGTDYFGDPLTSLVPVEQHGAAPATFHPDMELHALTARQYEVLEVIEKEFRLDGAGPTAIATVLREKGRNTDRAKVDRITSRLRDLGLIQLADNKSKRVLTAKGRHNLNRRPDNSELYPQMELGTD